MESDQVTFAAHSELVSTLGRERLTLQRVLLEKVASELGSLVSSWIILLVVLFWVSIFCEVL